MRFFITEGTDRPEDHGSLTPERWDLNEILRLIEQKKSFSDTDLRVFPTPEPGLVV